MLGHEEVIITIDDRTVTLRPTLRAAFHLQRKFGGFDKLSEALLEGSITAIAAIISEASATHAQASDVVKLLTHMTRPESMPLQGTIQTLTGPLHAFVFTLAGVDLDNLDVDRKPSSNMMTFDAYHARLYRLATGWLGWTPQETWDATPTEIAEAYAGHVDMLKAIHGGGNSDEDEPAEPISLDDKFARLARGLKARAA